jgi:hypothetical protein
MTCSLWTATLSPFYAHEGVRVRRTGGAREPVGRSTTGRWRVIAVDPPALARD